MPDGLENGQTTQIVAGSRIKMGKGLDAPIYVGVKTDDNPPALQMQLLNRTQGYPDALTFDGSNPLEIGSMTSGQPSPYHALVAFDAETHTFTLTPGGAQPQNMYVYTPKGEALGRL